ncbi:energy-coupling factor transporter ATP-binding protein EcfA2 [Methylobacterium sp. BE186]|uniref:ATP-binding protein n=1 Tax=Methylobacterium sp. BE186 TaxID=2817715 RepID=UPI002856B4AA|nr:ATP-binding protein [Methylobacterium sp. BE186]MDR7040487.1 energy-coupling factor transporter ATP-binding protein EcfA2 [Methylobacterium sp. BE186]
MIMNSFIDPLLRIRASQTKEQRCQSEVMERVRHAFVRTNRDTILRLLFDRLLADMTERREHELPHDRENRLEANIMVVLGPSGAGKSTSLNRLFAEHPATPGYRIRGSDCPLISVRAPSPCGVKELGRDVLLMTGYELKRRNLDGPEIWGIVRRRFRELGVVLLHIDELQHAPQSLDIVEQKKLRNALKGLLVDIEHPVGLVVSGEPEVEAFLNPDRQSTRRGRWLAFEQLNKSADCAMVAGAVKGLAQVADLEVRLDVEADLVARLMHAGCDLLGITIEEVHDAIREALAVGSTVLERRHFADAYALRTGNLPPWNPYLADRWHEIDPTRVLVHCEPNPDDVVRAARPRRQRRSA